MSDHTDWVRALAYSPCGQYLASGSDDSTVKIWDVHTRACLQTLGEKDLTTEEEADESWVRAVAYSPCGQYLASGSEEKMIKIWDAKTGAGVHAWPAHDQTVTTIVYSPCGEYLVSGSSDHTMKIWEVKTGLLIHTSTMEECIWTIACSPTGSMLAFNQGQRIKLWGFVEARSKPA